MLKIRLSRGGRKNSPFFRIVLQDHKRPTNGKVVEFLGFYNPTTSPSEVNVKKDRIEYWLGQGAKLSPSAFSIVKKEGVAAKKSMVVS